MTRNPKLMRAAQAMAALFVISLAAATSARSVSARDRAPRKPGHIFILILENESFARSFAANSRAPYLAHTLAGQGVLLRRYYGIGHNSLDNYLALVSGQAPNIATQRDCSKFTEFTLDRPTLDENGKALARGAGYPPRLPAPG